MAQPKARLVPKWAGAQGVLYDTASEADKSLAEDKDLAALVACLNRAGICWQKTSAEEIAFTVLHFFNVTPRQPQ